MPRGLRSSRLLVVLVGFIALLVVASAAVSRTGGAGGRTPRDRGLPPEVRGWADRNDPRGHRALFPALVSSDEPRKVAADLIRRSLLEAADLARIDADHEGGGGDGILIAGGDLTGDGKEDALEWQWGDGVTGVRGTDGNALWSEDFAPFGVPVPAGDLDGVAGDDLLTLEFSLTEVTGGWRYTVIAEALAGDDGATLWSRRYENLFTVVRAGPTKGYVDLDFAVPLDLADLDGDGILDLLVARYDTVIARDPGTGVREARVAALFESVSGADGSPSAPFTGTGRFGFPDAAVVPDLNGDDVEDLAVLSISGNRWGGSKTGTVAAHPGTGGRPLWQVNVPLPGQPFLQGVELNGDDAGDVLLSAGAYPTRFGALSGTNGSLLWTAKAPRFAFAHPAGDANGDGGDELLVTVYGYYYGFVTASAEAAADGSLGVPSLPGHELARSSALPHEGYGYGYGGYGCSSPYGYGYGCEPEPPCPGSGYGYGYGDIYGYGYGYGGYGYGGGPSGGPGAGLGTAAVAALSPYGYGDYGYGGYGYGGYGYGGYGYGGGCPAADQVVLALADGASGDPIWIHRDSPFTLVDVVGDANGDGIEDAAVSGFAYEESASEFRTITDLRSGMDGELAWSRVDGDGFVFGLGGDADGDGAQDLVVLEFLSESDRYALASGATGSDLWAQPRSVNGYLWALDAAATTGGSDDVLESGYGFEDGPFTAARAGGDGTRLWQRS